MRVALVVPRSSQSRLEGRLQLCQTRAVVAFRGHPERLAQQMVRLGEMLERTRRLEDEQQASLLPLRVELTALKQSAVERTRRVEQGPNRLARLHHVAVIATEREADEPGPQIEVEAQPDRERRVLLEE